MSVNVKSSAGIPLPKPIGRSQLARQQIVYGANYFPIHVPKFWGQCPEKIEQLEVLKIHKGGLTHYVRPPHQLVRVVQCSDRAQARQAREEAGQRRAALSNALPLAVACDGQPFLLALPQTGASRGAASQSGYLLVVRGCLGRLNLEAYVAR